jgi:hypothetical protein
MTRAKKALLMSAAIVGFPLASFAKKPPTLTGTIVAYNPLLHAAKSATYGSNREEIILETTEKTRFVKLVFVGFGTTQIEQKYFDGTTPLTAHALRDKSCDEKSPAIVAQVSLTERAGTYLLTDAFKNSPPKIKTLECYEATEEKK